jgi:cytoplasmic iron level regulating protein YaaA (DUF328/UPF0246 family)
VWGDDRGDVLIILPPSESKAPPAEHGLPVVLDQLSFPALNPMRARVLAALIKTSSSPEGFSRLRARPTWAFEVVRNTELRELPARPVSEVYTGPLHQGLDASTLSPAARVRSERSLVVTSVLWGALRVNDRIPPYRMHPCSHLIGMHRLEPTWRTVLPDVLGDAAGSSGVIVDLRSRQTQALGMPTGAGERLVILRVQQAVGHRRIGDVIAKRVRGQAAHVLLESGAMPDDPTELVPVLAEHWPVRLDGPERPGEPWLLTLLPSAT